ncbi:MAG: GWxTD domain-containing protein [Gemmatimonadaceae bacterium]|nr:GWxTD domain-containing protein [Gemmatimonadaceae bacterium]
MRRTLALALQVALATRVVSAQELASRADSVAEVNRLWSYVKRAQDDVVSWHRVGTMAWKLVPDTARRPGSVRGAENIRWLRMADSALRIAADRAPDSARFGATLASYLASSPDPSVRYAAGGLANRAVRSGLRGRDTLALAEAAMLAGDVEFRKFEEFRGRLMMTGAMGTDAPRQIGDMLPDNGSTNSITEATSLAIPGALDQYLKSFTAPIPDAGENAFAAAMVYYTTAVRAARDDPRAVGRLMRALAARDRWTELAATAQMRLTRAPWDAPAWMALGLARQRLDSGVTALAAFDSAFALLSDADRARMTRLERLTRSADARVLAKMDSAHRADVESVFWRAIDPLWSTPGNETYIEFLTRVAYADLMWTMEVPAIRGADTDRGQIYVRLGPPATASTFAPRAGFTEPSLLWQYNERTKFMFQLNPSYGRARLTFDDRGAAEQYLELRAPSFANMKSLANIDSLVPLTARFRAGGDTTELFIATAPRWSAIDSASGVRAALRSDLWVLDGALRAVRRDSQPADARPGIVSFTTRLRPGSYLTRLEHWGPGITHAARAQTQITTAGTPDWTSTGFGMSDLLLASAANVGAPGKRWKDFAPTPLVAALPRTTPLTLVWENYDLGTVEGVSRYRVSVRLQKSDKSMVGRIAARIVGGVTAAVGRTSTSDDNVALGFERTAAPGATIPDAIRVSLEGAPAGSYLLTVEITDLSNQRTATRTARLTLAP